MNSHEKPAAGKTRPAHVYCPCDMKILLVTPENRIIRNFKRGQWNNFARITMPYPAGFIPSRHAVTLIDESRREIAPSIRADLVGITCNTPNAPHVYAMADA